MSPIQSSKSLIFFIAIFVSSFPLFFNSLKLSDPISLNSRIPFSSSVDFFERRPNPVHAQGFLVGNDSAIPLNSVRETAVVTPTTSSITAERSAAAAPCSAVLIFFCTVETSFAICLANLFLDLTYNAIFSSSFLLIATCAAECSSLSERIEVWKIP